MKKKHTQGKESDHRRLAGCGQRPGFASGLVSHQNTMANLVRVLNLFVFIYAWEIVGFVSFGYCEESFFWVHRRVAIKHLGK